MGYHTIINTDSTLQFVVQSDFRGTDVRRVEVYPLIGWRVMFADVDGSELPGEYGADSDLESHVFHQVGMACIEHGRGGGIGGFVTQDTVNQEKGMYAYVTRGTIPGLYVGDTHVSEMTPRQQEMLSVRLTTELGFDKDYIDKLMS